MQKIVSTAQIQEIDRRAINEFGIPETILMENAGLKAVEYLHEVTGGLEGKRIGIFCGKGNNGGDGFVMARHLHINGMDVAAYLLADRDDLKGNARLNMEIYEKAGGRIKILHNDSDLKKHKIPIKHADVLVDAMLGTGLNSALRGMYKTAVEKINEWGRFVFAVDIPTGISSDNGAVFNEYIKADATITFGYPKTGMMFHPAAEACGELRSVNISFPHPLLDTTPCEAWLLDDDWAADTLRPPRPHQHKGSYGHAVISGGNTGMGGAVGLASLAALKVGAGLSSAAVQDDLARSFDLSIPEVMSHPLGDTWGKKAAEKLLAFTEDKSVLLLGPGMGQGDGQREFIEKIIKEAKIPLVIDADGLNNLADNPALLKEADNVIITPHPGEMGRLTGQTPAEVNADRLNVAKKFAADNGVTVALKGARTVIALPDGAAFVNPTGNPNLGSGGTGDVLGGMIAGYVAQGYALAEAACLGVYLHGLAADIYTEEEGDWSLTASSLIDYIPVALAAFSLEEGESFRTPISQRKKNMPY